MNKWYTIVVCVILIFSYMTVNAEETMPPELKKIMSVMADHDIELEEWSIYMRETKSVHDTVKQAKAEFEEIKSAYPRFTWKVEEAEGGHHWKAEGLVSHINFGKERIIFTIYPQKNRIQTYKIYEASGSKWSHDMAVLMATIKEDLFHKNPIIFTCVQGYKDDKIDLVLYKKAERLIADFKATEVESIDEGTFVSLSAYTDEWKVSIPSGKGKLNLQIALRKNEMGAGTIVTIGTPIITSEY